MPQISNGWAAQQPQPQAHAKHQSHRQPFATKMDNSHRSGHTSDRSESANEVENMLTGQARRPSMQLGWAAAPTQSVQRARSTQRGTSPVYA